MLHCELVKVSEMPDRPVFWSENLRVFNFSMGKYAPNLLLFGLDWSGNAYKFALQKRFVFFFCVCKKCMPLNFGHFRAPIAQFFDTVPFCITLGL